MHQKKVNKCNTHLYKQTALILLQVYKICLYGLIIYLCDDPMIYFGYVIKIECIMLFNLSTDSFVKADVGNSQSYIPFFANRNNTYPS